MTKKEIVNPQNPNGILVDMTPEEEAQHLIDIANMEARKQAIETSKQAEDALKASAKTKLMNGQPLTQEEVDTIVL